MGTIGSSVSPDSPAFGSQFGGEAEHMRHHRGLETAVESITVALTDVYTKPTLSITTTTAGSLIIALAAAGLITTVA